ncbi:uncharacterized protein PgNI_12334 [Pyricularia grisea]|uniref:Uncharacterized protein n=1 Tax=Pyricularia grisea TaxID=148305 RepID=A0A6P8AMS1_PYRGI|nr:uncharacterized protein PgNI_12334 [Pyricularia grisea]TLD03314.1 hypothetical protein PgNI_12334 [Pyricularia grisea]
MVLRYVRGRASALKLLSACAEGYIRADGNVSARNK